MGRSETIAGGGIGTVMGTLVWTWLLIAGSLAHSNNSASKCSTTLVPHLGAFDKGALLLVGQLLSSLEAEHIIEVATPLMRKSRMFGNLASKAYRTSSSAPLPMESLNDPVFAALDDRLSKLLGPGFDPAYAENPWV